MALQLSTLLRGLDHGQPGDEISATVILATIAFYGIWTAAVLVEAVIVSN